MALDPPQLDALTPVGLVGEVFVLLRDSVAAHFESAEAGKFACARGRLVVTTLRLCFLPAPGAGGRAVDVPLQGITTEKFQQPFFGANYLEGLVEAVPGRGLVNRIKFRFTFSNGGCGTFLRVFFQLIEQHRLLLAAQRQQLAPPPGPALFFAPQQMQAWMGQQQAFVDPADPSVLYLVQPPQPQAPQPQPQWQPQQQWQPQPQQQQWQPQPQQQQQWQSQQQQQWQPPQQQQWQQQQLQPQPQAQPQQMQPHPAQAQAQAQAPSQAPQPQLSYYEAGAAAAAAQKL